MIEFLVHQLAKNLGTLAFLGRCFRVTQDNITQIILVSVCDGEIGYAPRR